MGADAESTVVTQTVGWAAPRDDGLEITVHGVTRCVARPPAPPPDTRGPCVVEGTVLRSVDRIVLATAPASAGGVSWRWTGTFDCEIGLAYDPAGSAYHAIVLTASDGSAVSAPAIAEPGEWWEPAADDVIC